MRMLDFCYQHNNKVIKFMQRFQIRNNSLAKALSIGLFLFSLNWFYNYVGIYSFLDVRPTSVHSSAQCQRASIALNYFETDMNFFKPRVQKYSEMGGVTGVEFPVLYYLDALVYKCFGFNETNARLVSLAIVSLGFLFFYLMAEIVLKSRVLAIMMVGSAAASPVLLFYSPNFMPDAPSMAMVLASWYFFFRYSENGKEKNINLFLLCSTLAALIKVVALISVVALFCLLILEQLGFFKKTRNVKLFHKPWHTVIKIVVCTLIVMSWYIYANWLAKAYNNATFSLEPVMGDEGTLKSLLENIKVLWLYHYYAYESYVLMLFSIGFLILAAKHVNRLLFSITFLFFIGNLVFVYFFLNQFIHHDYYIISILPCVFFLFLTMADALVRISERYSVYLKFLFIIFIAFNMKETLLNCRKNYEYRYSNEIYYWTKDYRPYFDLEKRLREAGIKRTDLTVSGFDDTFCSSLYLMNQIGFQIAGWDDKNKIDEILNFKKTKYLILNDTARFNKLYPNNFAKDVVLTHRGLIVYKLHHKF